MHYDIIRDMVTLARADFEQLQLEKEQAEVALRMWIEAAGKLEANAATSLQATKIATIERERFEQRVADVVTFCLELLATIQAKTTWTHSQRNAFDLLLISELEKLVCEDVNDIPF